MTYNDEQKLGHLEERYKLTIKGNKYVTSCEIYLNGKKVCFGLSKVDDRKNYKAELGKKLAFSMAMRFFNKTTFNLTTTDLTGSPIFEEVNEEENSVI